MRKSAANRRSLLHRLLPVLILAVAAAITSGLILTREQPQASAAPIKRWNVNATTLKPVTASPELSIYGQFEPPQTTRLSSAINADVLAIPAQEGQTLEAGALLLRLDERDLQLQLRQRQADLAAVDARIQAEYTRHRHDLKALKLEQDVQTLNRDRVQRAESLHQKNLLSQEQLDSTRQTARQQALAIENRRQSIDDHPNRLAQLKAERERLQSLVEASELDLARARIRAPFNARVLEINTSVGNRVRPGDPLITLYDLDRIQLRAQLPDHWRDRLTEAQHKAELVAQARLNGQHYQLRLERLAARINTGQAGLDALFSVPPALKTPLPGQTLELQLQLPPRPGLFALPPEALYGSDRVYRLAEEDRLESVTVEVAGKRRNADGRQQVLLASPELKAGDLVITTQLPNAIGGLPVRVVE